MDEGLFEGGGSPVTVRIHNTNTEKIIVARFDLDDGQAAVDGDYLMPAGPRRRAGSFVWSTLRA